MASKRAARAGLDRLGLEPIGLTTEQAAAYLGISTGTFRKKVKAGKIPDRIPGLNRWSKDTLRSYANGGSSHESSDTNDLAERIRREFR